jgi:acyl-homoserine-lactone acylase
MTHARSTRPCGRPALLRLLVATPLLAACATGAGHVAPVELPELARQVEIRRTEHGVPHIRAENLRAAAFALAYVQLEDHGPRTIEGIHAARGRRALTHGAAFIDADARARLRHSRAVETFDLLLPDTREIYTGFAEGMNHFIRVHRDALPEWMEPDYTPQDVLTRDINWPADGAMNAFRQRLLNGADARVLRVEDSDDDAAMYQSADNVGSNAWALAPERTSSGHAILLRNPHLAWTAGYYEAHVRVPGRLDFYGDFRIGGPFTVIGGFNRDLGFSTTNNATRSHEFYALRLDPDRVDHMLLDDSSVPLHRTEVIVEYTGDNGAAGSATREFWTSDIGPVVHRSDSLVYIFRPTASGDYRAGEQWLEMMKARNLEEWQDAMRIGARMTSNFTYADRAGNIFYVWVSGAPLLPHEPGGDTLAIRVSRSAQIWSERASFDALPQLLNPAGGYIRNENDSPHYTNLNAILPHAYPFEVEEPRLRLRSQHGIELLHNERRFSLEDVVETKHSMRMLLADRVKDDLVAAVRATAPSGEVAAALRLIEAWDNSAAADSRGGVLFETWWDRYRSLMRGADVHAVEWTPAEPATTPRGLASAAAAAEAFAWAVPETARMFGTWDVAWGDVHRVRRGDVDAPVGGCSGALGCFRVLNFTTDDDGKRVVNGGDGWVIAVEFGDEPRAYSVLGYGQSTNPASPYHADQAALFAANRMKRVFWTEQDIEAATAHRYRPGAEARR